MSNTLKPDHLGDGVYVTDCGHQLMLTANHHDPLQATDVIYLDGRVLEALNNYNARKIALLKS